MSDSPQMNASQRNETQAGQRVLTLKEVAAELRVSHRHAEKLIASGALKRVGYTRRRLVTRETLDKFLAAA